MPDCWKVLVHTMQIEVGIRQLNGSSINSNNEMFVFVEIYALSKEWNYQESANKILLKNNCGVSEESHPKKHLQHRFLVESVIDYLRIRNKF